MGAGVDEQRLRVRKWLMAECGLVSAALGYAPERRGHTTINQGVRWAWPRPTEADELVE